MTAKETERLAKVEQKVDDLKEVADKNFETLNAKLDVAIAQMDGMNKSFVTIAQAKVAAWFIGTIIGIASMLVLIWSHLTK